MVSMAATMQVGTDQITVSGDDILIEYCERILKALASIPEQKLP
jgi:hypothetical protein